MVGVFSLADKTAFAVCSLVMIGALCTVVYIFTLKAYPTKVRAFALAVYSNVGRLGNVLMIFLRGELGMDMLTLILIVVLAIVFIIVICMKRTLQLNRDNKK